MINVIGGVVHVIPVAVVKCECGALIKVDGDVVGIECPACDTMILLHFCENCFEEDCKHSN